MDARNRSSAAERSAGAGLAAAGVSAIEAARGKRPPTALAAAPTRIDRRFMGMLPWGLKSSSGCHVCGVLTVYENSRLPALLKRLPVRPRVLPAELPPWSRQTSFAGWYL